MDNHLSDADSSDLTIPALGKVMPRLMVKRDRRRDEQPTPLAFVFDEQAHLEQHYSVTIARWSEGAIGQLRSLAEVLNQENSKSELPRVSLRGRIHLADQRAIRLDRKLGIGEDLTLLWTQTETEQSREQLNRAVLSWLTNDIKMNEDTEPFIMQLKELARRQGAIETFQRMTDPYQWRVSLGKTAKAPISSSYADLADFVAQHIEGKVIFPGLPGLRRIVSGELLQNQADLMTEPIFLNGSEPFSIVVRIHVFSYPGRPTPVISIEFSRRVWTKQLKEKSGSRMVRGYAFPDGSTRALPFTIHKTQHADGQWHYEPEADFTLIERNYFSGSQMTVEQILKDGPQLQGCKLLVALKHGTGERTKTKSGVPDKDKMDGFQNLSMILDEVSLRPWQAISRIKTESRSQIDSAQHWGKRTSEATVDRDKYQNWLKDAQESIGICYQGAQHIVIAVGAERSVEADAQLAEQLLHTILPDSLVITRIPLPQQVHGPRSRLPGKELKASERAALRAVAWTPFIETVKQHEMHTGHKIDGILVIAHEWYSGSTSTVLHDDQVNKRAARIALAVNLEASVQYLLPRDEIEQQAKHEKQKKPIQVAGKFEDRLMIAWLDLAFKSLGRVRPAKLLDKAKRVYATSGETLYPDRIVALGVVRRNKQRYIGNDRSFLPYAIELDMESGLCSASFAYEHPDTHVLTSLGPIPLPQALVKLAGLGAVQLTSAKKDRKKVLEERTQLFFKDRLADFGRRSVRPLVIIDADTSRSVWPWLKDEEIDPQNIHLADGYNVQAAWLHAQVVRIRTENSPKILWNGDYFGMTADTGEFIQYHAPTWAEAQLFKITDTNKTHVYLSFGSAIRTSLINGRSSYREIPGMTPTGRNTGKYKVAIMPQYTNAWSTPRGVEIVVVRPGQDDPDQIARLIEWLRQCYEHFGGWSAKPAPLFFESILREYLADYDLEEKEDDEVEKS